MAPVFPGKVPGIQGSQIRKTSERNTRGEPDSRIAKTGDWYEMKTDQILPSSRDVNVGEAERWLSIAAGGFLVLSGAWRGRFVGIFRLLTGAALLQRGLTGHCQAYEALGINTGTKSAEHGIKVEKSIRVNRSPEQVYQFWRHLENLPRFMNHLRSVREISPTMSHWVAEGPAGQPVEWDATIINEEKNRLIAWKSAENAQVANAGTVRFDPASDGETEVKVSLVYNPPGGKAGAAVAKVLGRDPEQQIEEDLSRFKNILETELPAAA